MNLGDILTFAADRAPERPALTFGERTYLYGELAAAAGRVAAGLSARGIGPGDRVALWSGNHPSFVSGLYGAWRAGAVVVPLHSELTEPEARHILDDSGAKVLLSGETQLARASTIGSGASVAALEELEATSAEPPRPPAVGDEDLALIAYTSGTSGRPKGAMLTHRNLRANLDQLRATPMGITTDDVTLCVLPLFHIYGLNVVLNLALDVGARIVLLERFDPRGALDAVEREGVTVIAAAPPAYVAWLSLAEAAPSKFATVRLAASGAAPLPREVLEGFTDRFGLTIWEGYGLTETSPTLTTTRVGGIAKAGSIGRPLPGVELKLITEEGDEAEPGDPGEVMVRGPNVFGGYWNRPDETAAAFADGWFRTGDVAVQDDDGDLFLVDRRRDLIIVSGFNVYPREVEEVLLQHPDVDDVAVVGDGHPYTGEQVRATVVRRAGATVDGEDLIAFCRSSLAPYKVPNEIEFAEAIPRNVAGKVLRRELRH